MKKRQNSPVIIKVRNIIFVPRAAKRNLTLIHKNTFKRTGQVHPRDPGFHSKSPLFLDFLGNPDIETGIILINRLKQDQC
jgi:hypothetical protein